GNVNPGTNTTEIFRFATLNDIRLALPTLGENPLVTGFRPGTTVNSGETVNPTYDDLLAIWDAYNGSGTEKGSYEPNTYLYGDPPGWGTGVYWSATPSTAGHAGVGFSYGMVYDGPDNGIGYVALELF
ncbi:MAG: hypothetical protein HQL47_05515, partial [Gammaproteobacteria bacterium]|nr:hypothetical protein [Gammaproteobacteria bacterium]